MLPFVYIPIWIACTIVGGGLGWIFAPAGWRSKAIGTLVGLLFAGCISLLIPMAQESFKLEFYTVSIVLAFVVGVLVLENRTRLLGIPAANVYSVALSGAVAGLVGGHLFHIAMHWSDFTPFTKSGFDVVRLLRLFAFWDGGFVYYGTFLAAVTWGYLYCRFKKLPIVPFLDLVFPGMILAQAFGRVGCLMGGCCYGRLCSLPWAITFPGRNPRQPRDHRLFYAQVNQHLIGVSEPRSLPVHPTQLYAVLWALAVFLFLYWLWPRRRFDGQILSLTLILTGTLRFCEECFRGDERPLWPTVAPFTVAQWVSIVLICSGIAALLYFRRGRALYRYRGLPVD